MRDLSLHQPFFTTLFVASILFITAMHIETSAAAIEKPKEILSLSYSFEQPHLQQIIQDNTPYHTFTIPNTTPYGFPGEPALPARGAYILLPPDSTVQDIKVNPGNEITLEQPIHLAPAEPPVPLTYKFQSTIPESEPSHKESTNEFFTTVGTYCYRGYRILVLTLHPAQYDPTTQTLTYTNKLTVTVEVQQETQQTSSLFRGLKRDAQRVQTMVDNPTILNQYSKQNTPLINDDTVHYCIITTQPFKKSFLPLKEDNEAMGIPTSIVTLSEINCTSPNQIRTYLKNTYLEQGTDYILLGGDVDVIPDQKLWVRAWPGSSYTTTMPSDMFYGCYDGTFNYDGDSRWGEPTDGDNGGDVDLLAEAYVGRASVSTLAEAQTFVEKTIAYRCSMGGYLKEILMVGEHLWSDPHTWGGDYMDELINGSDANGYTTVGIPSNTYKISKLYDKTRTWPRSEIMQHINDNLHIINHLGHSNYGYNMKLYSSHVLTLTNEKDCFIYSQGCNAGGFDQSDCIAEYFTIKTLRGAAAVIMNARYGWGMKGSTNGPSQHFHREFLDAIFGEDLPSIAMANQDSKEDNLWRINGPCMRWCTYGLNVFGDPMMSFSDQYTPAEFTLKQVTGGFGSVNLLFENTGEVDARMLTWQMDITGGLTGRIDIILDRFHIKPEGIIRPLPKDTTRTASLQPFFALGRISIQLTAEIPTVQTITKDIRVRGLGFFIVIEDIR